MPLKQKNKEYVINRDVLFKLKGKQSIRQFSAKTGVDRHTIENVLVGRSKTIHLLNLMAICDVCEVDNPRELLIKNNK